jgi:hypothetical protein
MARQRLPKRSDTFEELLAEESRRFKEAAEIIRAYLRAV